MTKIDTPEVTEPRDAAAARAALNDWLKWWHHHNPDQAHEWDFNPLEWEPTRPADLA